MVFGTFWVSLFNFINNFVMLRIADEDSVPEMRIIMDHVNKIRIEWCIHWLVVNGATRNAQCATFPHFKFIAYTVCEQGSLRRPR